MATPAQPKQDWAAAIDRLIAGEQLAFLELSRLVTGFLCGMRAYDFRDEWDDLIQEVILAAVEARRSDKLRDAGAAIGYLRSTTRFKFVDRIRRKQRRGEEQEPEVEPADPAWTEQSSAEETLDLQDYVASLPEKQRRAVRAVYVEGRTYPEAAEATGIPLGSLKRYLREGLAALREQLGPEWELSR